MKTGAESRFIHTSDQNVQLATPGGLWVDVEEFEVSIRAFRSGNVSECESALTLYDRDLLKEDLYADWCARKRDQLRASYQELLKKLGTLYENLGQHQSAIDQYEKLVASEPSNEEAHRELMRLYTLTGRRSEALRQYRRCSDAVRRELDADPEESDCTGESCRKSFARCRKWNGPQAVRLQSTQSRFCPSTTRPVMPVSRTCHPALPRA